MVQSQILAQSIFASYFAIILFLFWLILRSLSQVSSRSAKPQRVLLFFGLALASLCHTWYYMIEFLLWSFHDFETRRPTWGASMSDRVTRWLMGSELFEQAWLRVCAGPMNWWWSEQLCILTVGVWTTFLFVQGSRRRIPHVWAYMLLGQVVAISVASNLFFAAVLLSPAQGEKEKVKRPVKIPPRVYIPILLSHLTILISPTVAQSNSKWFLPNLLAMHALIVLPLIDISFAHNSSPSSARPNTGAASTALPNVDPKTCYLILALLALVPRAQTYLTLLHSNHITLETDLMRELWTTLHEHPAQSSIGYDVLWTTVSFAAYCSSVLGIVSPGLALYLDDDQQN